MINRYDMRIKTNYKKCIRTVCIALFSLAFTGCTKYDLNECNDVFAICQANGLTDKRQIAKVIDVTEKSEFDLRCVKDAIHREKKVAAAK